MAVNASRRLRQHTLIPRYLDKDIPPRKLINKKNKFRNVCVNIFRRPSPPTLPVPTPLTMLLEDRRGGKKNPRNSRMCLCPFSSVGVKLHVSIKNIENKSYWIVFCLFDERDKNKHTITITWTRSPWKKRDPQGD